MTFKRLKRIIDKNNIPKQVEYVTCLIINLINEENEKLTGRCLYE